MFQAWLKKLSDCLLFQGINVEELDLMLQCLNPKVVNYSRNELITVAGEKFTGVGVILDGEVAITKENAVGNRMLLTLLGGGDIFGEMAAFARKEVWSTTVLAQESSIIMFLPPDKIIGNCENVCVHHRQLILNLLRIISDNAFLLERKLEYLAIKSLRGKISTFLLEEYKRTGKSTFLLPLNRNELADFLNVSRPSLSREMGRMRDEGMIDFHRASMKLIDIACLRQMTQQ
ncbi:MAG: Crp/Fnr family transcriptional regulator [Syntrophomonadaceae bacterium]|nr:Crp/Fnr family transcriptional regulator [Syntrophomonadaceae bacterium]